MGAELGPAFEVLSQDLMLAYANWGVHRALFSDRDRRHLLMQAAGPLFDLLESALLSDVVLQLARLVDRPETSPSHLNLTLQCLPELVSSASENPDLAPLVCKDPGFRSNVEAMVSETCDACQFAIKWRHKRIAHRDRAVALGIPEEPLPEFEFTDIGNALRMIASVLNEVEACFSCGATTAYEFTPFGGADSLFCFLKRGMEAADADAGL